MVLLSNDNPINIQKIHLLKCLEKKKENFNIEIIPIKEKIQIEESFKNMNLDLSDVDIKSILVSNIKNNSKK
jgi:hypothetical protein